MKHRERWLHLQRKRTISWSQKHTTLFFKSYFDKKQRLFQLVLVQNCGKVEKSFQKHVHFIPALFNSSVHSSQDCKHKKFSDYLTSAIKDFHTSDKRWNYVDRWISCTMSCLSISASIPFAAPTADQKSNWLCRSGATQPSSKWSQ